MAVTEKSILEQNLELDLEALAEFCRQNQIRKLSIFGSATRDDFAPESDVDVLVEFDEHAQIGLAFFGLPEVMSPLFGGRRVDLVTKNALHRLICEPVLAEALVLYDAA